MFELSKSQNMVRSLLGIGFSPIASGVLLEMEASMCDKPKIKADDMRYLKGPIIVHTRHSDIKNHLVHELKGFIYQERFDSVFGRSRLPVGPVEICCVMHDATLEAPLNSDLAKLYLWAGAHTTSLRFGKQTPEQVFEMCAQGDNSPMVTTDQLLTRYDVGSAYRDLAQIIRRKVITAAGSSEKYNHAAEIDIVGAPFELFASAAG
jgi:hypothetical protein